MPLSANAQNVFLENFKRLRSLSASSSSHEIGEAVGIVRKFIWKDDNLNKLRKSLGGYADECRIEVEGLDPKVSVDPASLAKYKVLIPYLSVLPGLGIVRTYIAARHTPGDPTSFVQGTLAKSLDLDRYREEPFVVVDGL